MPLNVISIGSAAAKLERPFTLEPLLTVGDLAISLYLCQGQVKWHDHLDEDELFLVHEGLVTLETERGKLTLHSEEVAVVPKGVSHRTRSDLRSLVVLVRPTVLTDRKNGHRHGASSQPPLERVRLLTVLQGLQQPYEAARMAVVEEYELLAFRAQGAGRLEHSPAQGLPLLVVRGSVSVDTGEGEAQPLNAGELCLVPPRAHYRLSAPDYGVVLTLRRAG